MSRSPSIGRGPSTTSAGTPAALALDDLFTTLRNTRFWLRLAWIDILQRYRGSLLGPLWLTISTGAFIIGLGPLYAQLFGTNLRDYLPYMTTGLIVWNFINATINESCRTFIDAGGLMKQIRMPRTTHIFHMIARNAIIFGHSIPLFFPIALYFGLPFSARTLLAIPGFFLLCGNLIAIGMILAIIGVRFRDSIQLVGSVMQIAFFVTPILWHPGQRPLLRLLTDWNPLAAMIALIRDPLLDEWVSVPHLIVTVGGFIVLSTIAFLLFARYRRRIIYWV